jgi:hypothetical protein
VGETENPFSRAFGRIQAGARFSAELPFALQLSGVAAVLLALSTFAPLYDERPFPGESWVAELDYNLGIVILLAAIAGIVLLIRLARQQRAVDSGALAALGLLATITVALEGIRIHDSPAATVGWGVYVSLAAAVALLIGGLLLLGGQEPSPPPPS